MTVRDSKTPLLAALCAALVLTLCAQELHYEAGVVNIEVPVRVFDGDRFVDNLTINDFQVFEDGKPQKIVALYLIRKTEVRKEEAPDFPKTKPAQKIKTGPETQRNFLLIFELLDPMPKVNEAIDYFFREVFRKGDQVTIVSPKGTYRFKQELFDRVRPSEVARQIKANLRKDILAGSTDYRRVIQDIKILDVDEAMDPDIKARLILNDIRELRERITINDQGIRQLAQTLKTQEGRKIVFLFYEKEEIVIPVSKYVDGDSEYAREARRPTEDNVKDIEKIFADASMTVNFIFLTNSTTSTFDITDLRRKEGPGGDGRSLTDVSGRIFEAFREMSQASGGTTESSTNALAAFKKTVTASENYYLLYYVPSEYKADGKFKEIKVTVKGKHYQVSNRSGYIAK
jgi:VWFA-related protein